MKTMNTVRNNPMTAATDPPQGAEQWRPVVADLGQGPVETTYEVSSEGRVRNTRTLRGKRVRYVLRPTLPGNGYLYVWIIHNGKRKMFTVHSLVARAFIGPRSPRYTTDHINNNRLDNRAANLQYLTIRDNSLKSAYTGGKINRGANGKIAMTFELHIRLDGTELEYRCTSWADFEARTGCKKDTAKMRLSASPQRRIHLRCGITVWQTERNAANTTTSNHQHENQQP